MCSMRVIVSLQQGIHPCDVGSSLWKCPQCCRLVQKRYLPAALRYVNKVEYNRYWTSTSQYSGSSEAGVPAQCTNGVIAYLDSSSIGSSGELTYALPAHSATSTRRMGTASCVTTARRSRRAQQLRFTSSAHSCCRYKCQPFTGGPVYRR